MSATALYFLALAKIGPHRVGAGEPVATRKQVCAFIGAIVILWVASDWPIHDLAEQYLYSVHMLEHELITLAAPPLLLVALPDWLARDLLARRGLRTVARVASRPLAAGVIFNLALLFFHAPPVVNFTLTHHTVHFAAHLVMFGAALVMWFPVLNRLDEYGRMSYPAKFLYLFLMTVAPDVPIFFLALSPHPLFHFYATVPRPFALTAVGDQQLAAGLMNFTNILFFGCLAAVMFFRWWSQEETLDRRWRDVPAVAPITDSDGDVVGRKLTTDETLTWDDVRRDLQRAERPEFRAKRSS
jgi:putative membrane protein